MIIFLFALFAFLHSLTASAGFKNFIAGIAGEKIAFYRLFYNIFSLLLFYLIYSLMPQPSDLIYDLPVPYDIIVLIPQYLGLAGILWSLKYFSLLEFLGIEQLMRWKDNTYNTKDIDEKLTLRIAGPYRFMRHPVYFFTLVFLLFRPMMDLFYLILFICIGAYFYIGSIYEEKKLVKTFGSEYENYRRQVPRIIPIKLFHPYKSV